jgi:hypothetical protein
VDGRTVAAALAVFFGGVHGCEGEVEGDGVGVLVVGVHGVGGYLRGVGCWGLSYIFRGRESVCSLTDDERCGVGKQTRVRLEPVRFLLVGHMGELH